MVRARRPCSSPSGGSAPSRSPWATAHSRYLAMVRRLCPKRCVILRSLSPVRSTRTNSTISMVAILLLAIGIPPLFGEQYAVSQEYSHPAAWCSLAGTPLVHFGRRSLVHLG